MSKYADDITDRAPKDAPRELPPPTKPMDVARRLVAERYTCDDGTLALRHWRGGWWRWRTSHWLEVETRSVRGAVYRFTEHAVFVFDKANGDHVVIPWAPNRYKVADVADALAAICFLPETVQQPAWIDDANHPDGTIVACSNGLLHVETRALLAHNPRFFNVTAVPLDYDADAAEPTAWLEFLAELWGDDVDSIAALQEFMGYVVSGRLDLQKILLVVGPTRGGKGAIARVLAALIGSRNVAGPTMSSLSTDFGLAPLIGKPLAVISDARLNGRGTSTVVERLLAISGEDVITVNIKHKEQWTGRLPSRFMILSNELPHFGDAAAAIVGRFVILLLNRSWLNNEDHDLEPRLHAELAEILSWTLDGLDRLRERGRFTRPTNMDEVIAALTDLASPVAAFVRERCHRDIGGEVSCADLFDAWKRWADSNGHKAGSTQRFGRDLRAVIPMLNVAQPRDAKGRNDRVYRGVVLAD